MLFSFRFNKRDRLFYSYLLSYFVIILVTLSMTILGYTLTIRTLEQEMATASANLLSQVAMNLDSQITQVEQLNQSLTDIPDMDLLSHNYFLSGTDLLKIKDLSQTLNNAKKSTPIIEDILVYFHENDNIITTAKRYNPKLQKLFLEGTYTLNEDFSSLVTFDAYKDLLILENKTGDPILVFRQNLFNNDYKSQLVTILILVPWSSLVSTMPDLTDGDIFLLSPDNHVLQHPGTIEELSSLTYDSLQKPYDLTYQTLDRRNLVTFYAPGSNSDLKYGLAYLKTSFFSRLRYIQALIVIQLIFALFLALYLAFFYSKKVYKPIGKLMNIFKKHTKLPNDDVTLLKLGDNLESLYIENTTLTGLYNKAMNELDMQVLSGYLKGWSGDLSQIRTILTDKYGILETNPYLLISVIYNDLEESKLFLETNKASDQNAYELLHYVFKNVFTEQVLSSYAGTIATIEGQEVCLISLKAMACEDHFIKTLTDMQAWFKTHLNLTMYIAGSAIHTDFINLTKAYHEAGSVLTHQLFWEDKSDALIFYDGQENSIHETGRDSIKFLDYEKRFYNLLSEGQTQEALSVLDTILTNHFINDITYAAINRSRIFSLMNVIYSYMEDHLNMMDPSFGDSFYKTQQKLYNGSLDEAKISLGKYAELAIMKVKEKTDSDMPSWLPEMVSYLDQHYSDSELNVAKVALAFNMNVAYVGRTFKKHMGESVLDYFHKKRIEAAKERLPSTDSLTTIALEVGYMDAKTLIRVFKKYEGATPGVFRE